MWTPIRRSTGPRSSRRCTRRPRRTHFLDRWTRRRDHRRHRPGAGGGRRSPTSAARRASCSRICAQRYPDARADRRRHDRRRAAQGPRGGPGGAAAAGGRVRAAARGWSLDAVVSANLLEHVPDDRRALREIARVLRPGGRPRSSCPPGPGTFDYYDRFLGHERRYARRRAGRQVPRRRPGGRSRTATSPSLLYPAFWLVKQRNRRALRRPARRGARAPGHAGHRADARLARRARSPGSWSERLARPASGFRSGSARSSSPAGPERRRDAGRSASSSRPTARRPTSSACTSGCAHVLDGARRRLGADLQRRPLAPTAPRS